MTRLSVGGLDRSFQRLLVRDLYSKEISLTVEQKSKDAHIYWQKYVNCVDISNFNHQKIAQSGMAAQSQAPQRRGAAQNDR